MITHPEFVAMLSAALLPTTEDGEGVVGQELAETVTLKAGYVGPAEKVIAASAVPLVYVVEADAVVEPVTVEEYSPFPYCEPEDIVV